MADAGTMERAVTNAELGNSMLPREWEIVEFDASIQKGRLPVRKIKSSDYMAKGRFPIVDQGQGLIAGYWDDSDGLYDGQEPVIVFGDHTRTFKYIDFPFFAGADGTQILRPNTKIFDPRFLYYALTFLSIPSRGYNRHYSILRQKHLSRPPLSEQRAIAHVLRTVQRAKEATEKVIAAARQLKQSLMRHLFTYGPVPFHEADRVELQETELGQLPAAWRLKQVSDVCEVKTSTSSLKTAEASRAGGVQILYLKVSDMNLPSNIRQIVTSAISFEIDAKDALSLNTVPPGATVLPKRGAAIATNKKRLTTSLCLLDPNLLAVIPKDALENEYLFSWFERFDLRTITDITTLPQLNKKDIEPLLLPLPSRREQRDVVRVLEATALKVHQEQARRNALQSLFDSILHSLMTGRTRVHDLDLPVMKEDA
jgi:type I restriction enzyme S subunit